jgi:hypothetical protein
MWDKFNWEIEDGLIGIVEFRGQVSQQVKSPTARIDSRLYFSVIDAIQKDFEDEDR